ncbi:DoxX family protein [Rhodanobacter sp. DHG33]|uniref:DoxX family protein n=1 Tax=Rhodanobacter sp. DHG33 TaxID=2775921 RepID=UPI0017864680|nr:DoxX family protein [Rhodanobacter sp. DHG33]MBD8898266.1 DoxX family protein [Rhodanobacter sp. DHG33]
MRYALFENQRDALLLVARLLLMLLFVLFGFSKLTDYTGTSAYMAAEGLPLPMLAAAVVIAMEFFVGLAIVLGFWTRPLALLLALYTLGTALVAHHYWTMGGADRMANMINFYKNLSIIGGLLLLCLTGPGRYSIDRR